jgi:hypothetical protein
VPPTSYRLQLASDVELVVWFLAEATTAAESGEAMRAARDEILASTRE